MDASTSPGIGAILRAEARGLVLTIFSALWKTTAVVGAALALWFSYLILRSSGQQPAVSPVTGVMVAVGLGAFYGACAGLAVAALSAGYRLFGGWLVLPLLLGGALTIRDPHAILIVMLRSRATTTTTTTCSGGSGLVRA